MDELELLRQKDKLRNKNYKSYNRVGWPHRQEKETGLGKYRKNQCCGKSQTGNRKSLTPGSFPKGETVAKVPFILCVSEIESVVPS